MSIYHERSQILRAFIAAQVSVCFFLTLACFLTGKWEVVAGTFLAVVLQSLQTYFFGKPALARQCKQWFSGVVFAVALKYVVLIGSILILLKVFPVLSDPRVFLYFSGAFFIAYALPFWYCGIRLAKFSNDILNQQLINRV